jgi:hypothetical protein
VAQVQGSDVQKKLIYGDPVAIQDGLHNLIQTPDFQQVMNVAVASFLGGIFEPDLIEKVRRFVAKGDRNDSRSYRIGTEPPTAGNPGRTRILDRDPSRVEAIVYNAGSAAVYVGGRQVTVGGLNDASGGIPIQPNTGLILDSNIGELFCISGTDGMDVRVLDIAGGV